MATCGAQLMDCYALLTTALQTPAVENLLTENVLDLVLHASITAKVVLAILLVFSLISWAIILDKLRSFRNLRKDSENFMQLFEKRKNVREILQASNKYSSNPFAAVFKEAYWLFNKGESPYSNKAIPTGMEPAREQKTKASHAPQDLVRLFDSVASREVLSLEKNLVFLATTGNVSPFFGLFGTVWGVMIAFLSVGYTGSADLSVVAPGIAEALITTLAGLGAAIPAVMGYNYFVNKLKRLSAELEIFYSNLIEAFARKDTHEVR
jgi:biopolymer transport protein TolQ